MPGTACARCSLQIFAANFYSFFADALARLVIALDVSARHLSSLSSRVASSGLESSGVASGRVESGRAVSPPPKLRIALPADGARLRPWMWALLERVGISRENSFPYPVSK